MRAVLSCLLFLALGVTVRPASGSEWLDARVGPFEIYSDETPGDFEQSLLALQQLHEAATRIWPLPPSGSTPHPVILFVSHREYLRFNPQIDRPETNRRSHWAAEDLHSGNGRPPMLMLNGRIARSDQLYFKIPLFYGACGTLLLGERAPSWLVWGYKKMIQALCCGPKGAFIPPLSTDATIGVRERGGAGTLAAALRAGTFLTFRELFTEENPRIRRFNHDGTGGNLNLYPGDTMPGPGVKPFRIVRLDGTHLPWWSLAPFGPFVDESYEFAYYCLLGGDPHMRESFLHFSRAAANGPLDETDFTRIFGLNYQA
ncbi:MAG TPA: hypothetical protein VFE31_00005, partial [Opitutaceae bacterium]|nr:hypothetical protein [Opitutaceae bacterium]